MRGLVFHLPYFAEVLPYFAEVLPIFTADLPAFAFAIGSLTAFAQASFSRLHEYGLHAYTGLSRGFVA